MRNLVRTFSILFTPGFLLYTASALAQQPSLGLFEKDGDVGQAGKTGSVEYDPVGGSYAIAGGGENMWFTTDAFHYLWKQMSGDLSIAADIAWMGTGGNAHRKACLLIRQTLDADSFSRRKMDRVPVL